MPSSGPGDERCSSRAAVRWKGHLRGARAHGLTKRTERVRTYHGTHGTAAPIGYYAFSHQGSESTRRGLTSVRQSWALGSGARTRGRRRLGYGTRTVVGAMVRLPEYSQGTRRGLAGYSRARAWTGMRGAAEQGRARHPPRGRTEHEHARGYCKRYRVPHGAGPLPGLLSAYSRPRAARARARQCAGACRRTQGCSRNTNGPGRSHAGARRGIARGAGAQGTQLIERRQRGGDRAVERVRLEIPATCLVRPAVQ